MSSDSSEFTLEQKAAIASAAALLRKGGVVAIPTETVYGLGANALDPIAVARVFEIKERPRFDPLIVHVPDEMSARALALKWTLTAEKLAKRFWPGSLTIVVPKQRIVPDIVTAGLPSVALRVPDHALTLALLRAVQLPIAAPSANPFGAVSPTTAAHVRDSLGSKVDLVLDGGPCRTGVESTVLALDPRPKLLRPGGVPIEEIEAVIGPVERLTPGEESSGYSMPSPGMLKSHYATRTPLYLAGREPARKPNARIGWLGLGRPTSPEEFTVIESLSESGDLKEAASNLFSAMRRLDTLQLERIVAESPPPIGLGAAIADRLSRASRG